MVGVGHSLCREMLCELAFDVEPPVGLNQLLLVRVRKRRWRRQVFVWKNCGRQLNINMDVLYDDLEATEFDS